MSYFVSTFYGKNNPTKRRENNPFSVKTGKSSKTNKQHINRVTQVCPKIHFLGDECDGYNVEVNTFVTFNLN